MTRGVIYVNSAHDNLRYIKEAVRSAESIRRLIPDVAITLHTDATNFSHPAFDRVVPARFEVPPELANRVHMRGQMLAKIRAMLEFEFEYTMYLGSDTLSVRPEVASVFRLLDRFDIAASHAPLRINTHFGNSPIPEVPACFPEFNGDVLVFRKTPQVEAAIREWLDLYLADRFGHPHDQGTLRYVLYNSALRIATLPPEYNWRKNYVAADTVLIQNRETIDTYLGQGGLRSRTLAPVRRLLWSLAGDPHR